MPIVFVHGVNNRIEDLDYSAGVAQKTEFIKSILAPRVGLDPERVVISFPYWGNEGVTFRWNQASLPRESDKVETLAMKQPGPDRLRDDLWLGEVRLLHGQQGVKLGDVSRLKGFEVAVDLVWDTAAALAPTKATNVEIAEIYAASLKYAEAVPVPQWAFQTPTLSNQEFVDRLIAESHAYRSAESKDKVEALGLTEWIQSLKEKVSRLADMPSDAATSLIVGLARKSVHQRASRFLGDIFMYLTKRGDSAPGKILEDILKKLREGQASKRAGDEKLIVIGHSLGGVIMYDILTNYAKDIDVDVLVTVGSQVAVFEEMALYRASKIEPPANPAKDRVSRPQNVAKWLNVYDTNDVFSFCTEGVFSGVEDYRFDTGYGLLEAHGGYFSRPSFYKRLAARLQEA